MGAEKADGAKQKASGGANGGRVEKAHWAADNVKDGGSAYIGGQYAHYEGVMRW